MVTQSMYRPHEEKKVFSEKKNPICDINRSNQMPEKDQITEIAPNMLTYLELFGYFLRTFECIFLQKKYIFFFIYLYDDSVSYFFFVFYLCTDRLLQHLNPTTSQNSRN